MAPELLAKLLSTLGIPNPHCCIHGAGSQVLPVRTPVDSQHPPGVPLQRKLWSARIGIPDAGSVITASRCQAA